MQTKAPTPFRAHPLIWLVLIAATGEASDLQLTYSDPASLRLDGADLPPHWPSPRDPLPPFSGGLVDHMRAVGPGVFVGVGWKAPREGKRELGRRFLHFVMVKRRTEPL